MEHPVSPDKADTSGAVPPFSSRMLLGLALAVQLRIRLRDMAGAQQEPLPTSTGGRRERHMGNRIRANRCVYRQSESSAGRGTHWRFLWAFRMAALP